MWILAIVLVAASLGALAGPVEATDLTAGPLFGYNFYCSAVNKSAGNITVTLSIVTVASSVVTPLQTCGPFTVGAKKAGVCTIGFDPAVPGGAKTVYCKITTSSSTNTRGNLMLLEPAVAGNATANSEAK